MKKILRNQTGDTIVEVMIAMAVASLVLGGAYSITNRSLANSRQAQEHAEAAKLVQSQLEQIRFVARTTPAATSIFEINRTYCIAASAGSVAKGQPKQFNSAVGIRENNETLYPAECKNIGSVNYRTGFVFNASNNVFTVFVNWDGATGVQDHVSMVYKAYPGE